MNKYFQPDADEGLQPTTDKHIWYPVEEKSHPPYCEMIRNSITRFRFFNICFTWLVLINKSIMIDLGLDHTTIMQ